MVPFPYLAMLKLATLAGFVILSLALQKAPSIPNRILLGNFDASHKFQMHEWHRHTQHMENSIQNQDVTDEGEHD